MSKRFWPVLGLLCIMMTFPAYAGDINGNEQEIVGVINSQFEKDGIIYRVKQEYINSAMNYLRQDDIDLGPDDVQLVIGEIYANVQTGVESGYLEEVGRAETQQTSPKVPAKSSGPSGTEKTGEAEDGESGEMPGTDPGADGSSDSEIENGGKSGNGETTGGGEQKPMAAAISILELMDSMPGQNYGYITEDTDRLVSQLVIPYRLMWTGILCLATVMAVLGLLCLWEKCFAAHHHRRFRNVLKQVLGLELFCLILAMELLFGTGLGAFHDSAVLNRLNQTEYYRTIYEELRHDTRISFALMDVPDNVMDNAITYERVVMAARQQVDSTLNKGSYQANTNLLTERLEKDIRSYLEESSIALTDKAETGLDLLINRLDDKYTQLLQWPFAPWWVQLADKFVPFMKKAGAALVVMTAAVHALLFWIHHYGHRAVRTGGWRILSASLLTVAAGAYPYVVDGIPLKEMRPEYMGQFFYAYERGILLAVMMVGAAGILIGTGYLLMARSWKEGKQQQ